MVEKNLTPHSVVGGKQLLVDETDSINSTGVAVDNGNYGNGTFKDRDYDIRGAKAVSILLKNIGANSIDYTILGATKNFNDPDTELDYEDYGEVLKAETAIVEASKSTGSVQITAGTSGSVDTVDVDGVALIDAAVPFNSDIDTTASDLADAINAKITVPNYSAVAATDTVTITREDNIADTGVVTSTVTATITTTDVNMSGGADGRADIFVYDAKLGAKYTAIRISAKETSAGSPGKLVADIIVS